MLPSSHTIINNCTAESKDKVQNTNTFPTVCSACLFMAINIMCCVQPLTVTSNLRL